MGFRRTGRGSHRRQNRTKSAADPRRCQPLGRQRPLPRQPQVADEPAGEAKLAVGRCHGPGEPVSLLRGAGPGQGPVQGLLPKADGVLDVEPANVGPPQQRQIRGGTHWAGPPQPQRLGPPGTARAAVTRARGPGCQPRSSAARRRRGRCAAWDAAHSKRSRSPAHTAGRPLARWPWAPARWPDRPATAWRRGGPGARPPSRRGWPAASKFRSLRMRTNTWTGAPASSTCSCTGSTPPSKTTSGTGCC